MGFGTGWEVQGLPYSSTDPNYCAVEQCVYLTNSASITQRGIGTFRFNSITLQYSITPYAMSITDKCDVSYSIDNGQNWIILQEYDDTSNNQKINHIQSMGKDADNLATGIAIKFEAKSDPNSVTTSNSGDHRCYVDEVYVFGIYGSRHPSNYPTADPTAMPSVSPTNPTFVPSVSPSIAPTVSSQPPSTIPSATPSDHPTQSPTPSPVMPWGIVPPTAGPTLNPVIMTLIPSQTTDDTPSAITPTTDLVQMSSTIRDAVNNEDPEEGIPDNSNSNSTPAPLEIVKEDVIEEIEPIGEAGSGAAGEMAGSPSSDYNFALWVLIIACIFIIIMMISWIYSTKLRKFKNDFYRLSALIVASVYILDLMAYILFIFNITCQYEFMSSVLLKALLVTAVTCIILPVCIGSIQLYCQVKKWKKHSLEFAEWISNNTSFLCFLSVLTLSPFTAVKLCTSHLFNLNQFAMPVSHLQSSQFQSKRLYTTILAQNVPQMVTEIIFIFYVRNESSSTNGPIIYVAVSLSLLCIFMGIYEMTKTKHAARSENFVSIEFDVMGIPNARKHRNRVKDIRDKMSTLIGVNVNSLEVVRPCHIPKGLRVVINVGINHDPKKIAKNIGIMIIDAHENGELNEIIETAWSLSQAPVIDNVAVI